MIDKSMKTRWICEWFCMALSFCWRLRYIWGKKLEIIVIKFYKIIKILRAPWLVKNPSLIAPINPWKINCFLSDVDECSKWTDAIRSFKLIPSKWTDAIQIHLALIPRAQHANVLAILCKLGMVLNVKVSLVFHEGDEIYILFPTLNVAVNWPRADFHSKFTSRRHNFRLPCAQKRNNFWLYMTINIWKSCMCTAIEETNIEAILAVMNTTELVVKIRPENNSGPYGISTHDLYDTGATLYQLS